MTISFSYAYLNGLDRRMVSSLSVHINVQRPNRAMSPRMTKYYTFSISTWYQPSVLTIHQNGLRDIIGIVPGNDMVYTQARCPTI